MKAVKMFSKTIVIHKMNIVSLCYTLGKVIPTSLAIASIVSKGMYGRKFSRLLIWKLKQSLELDDAFLEWRTQTVHVLARI